MQWPKVQLGTAVTILDSMRKPVKAGDRIEGPYPYYGANGQQGTINDFIFDEPLILVAEDGGHFFDPSRPIAYRIEGKTWVNNHAHVLRCNPDMDISYLCHQLARYNVQQYLTGSTRAKLTKGALERIPITKPPLKEQKRIAAILDKADEIKNTSNQTITLRNEAILSYFEELISHCDDFVNLSEFAELINGDRGKNYPSGTDIVEEGIRFINAGHIVDFSLTKDKEKMNYITSERFELLRGGKIQRNDLLYCLRGSLGKCALIEDDELGSIASSLVIIRPNTDVVNPIFLVWYLRSQYGVRQILRFDNGTAQPNLSAKSVKSYSIPNLPLTEQNKFARFVTKICDMESVTKLSDDLINSSVQLVISQG